MRSEEFISTLLHKIQNGFPTLKNELPLGVKEDGSILRAHERADERPYGVNHTCVTGNGATAYIQCLITVLSTLYKKGEAQFLILSPKTDYAQLLSLQNADITLPYIRSIEDIKTAKEVYARLLEVSKTNQNAPKLFLVLDGLEDLDGGASGDLSLYREFLELSVKTNAEVITGANLIRSIFSGFPGAFVGVGNCLLTTDKKAQADATFVCPDSSMALPVPVAIPSEPSVSETVLFVNAFRTHN